jgi:hypothetical protein
MSDMRNRRVSTPNRDRIFFSLTALWFVVLVFVGFARTFYFRSLPEPLPTNLIVHGVVYSAWVVLFFVQAVLISARRPRWHFALGSLGAVLLVLMIPVGFQVVLVKAVAGLKSVDHAGANLTTLAVGFALAFAGLANRKRPFVHKRLMVFATLMLTVAAADRVAIFLGLDDSRPFRKVLAVTPGLALVIYDASTQRRIPFLSLGLLTLAWLVLWFVISDVVFTAAAGEAIIRALARVFVW